MGEVLNFPRNKANQPTVTSEQTLRLLDEFVVRIFNDDEFAARQAAESVEPRDIATIPFNRQLQ